MVLIIFDLNLNLTVVLKFFVFSLSQIIYYELLVI